MEAIFEASAAQSSAESWFIPSESIHKVVDIKISSDDNYVFQDLIQLGHSDALFSCLNIG